VPQNKKYNLTIQAKDDIKEIWNYTVDHWGEEQAEKYCEQLEDRFEWLAENPCFGKKEMK